MISQDTVNADKVRIEYFGPRVGAVTYHGKRRKYRFGNNPIDRYEDVNPEDVETLLRTQGFRIVKAEAFAPQAGSDFIPAPDNEPGVSEDPIKATPVEVDEFVSSEGGTTWDTSEFSDDDIPDPIPATVKEIQAAVGDADIDTLLAWLNAEQSGKKRKTALEAINAALEEHFA